MKKIIISLLFIALIVNVRAQENKIETKNRIFGVPQYLIVNGLRFDWEHKLQRENKWLVISPTFYSQYESDYKYDKDQRKLIGGGLEIDNKYVLGYTRSQRTNVYFTYGIMGEYLQKTELSANWSSTVDELGNSIQILNTNKDVTDIYRVGGNALMGMQTTFFKNLYLDMYMGFGIRYSEINEPSVKTVADSDDNTSDPYFLDHTYTGVMFIMGLKLGVGF